jgi:hypothetical protein
MKFILFSATVFYTMIALVAAAPAPEPQFDAIIGGLPIIGPIIIPPQSDD